MSNNQGEDFIEISDNYFKEFKYETSEYFCLISPVHNKDTFPYMRKKYVLK
jgi:hypothetical protein